MKNKSLFSLMVSLAVLGVGSLPVFAQSQRYPTNAEIQRLTPDFHRQIKFWSTYDRNPENLRAAKSFTEAWSYVNPSVAPFLGHWAAEDLNFTI